jgi:ABC-type multidrug transport system fused ATPase/permease subunit
MSSNISLASQLLRLWTKISTQRRKQCALLMLLTILASVVEVVSIGAVLPFLGVLTAPEKVFSHPLAQPLVQVMGIQQPQELLLPFTVAFSVAALLSGGGRLLLLWAQTRLGHAIGTEFSIEIYRRTLYQPYAVHLARNSSEVISGITAKTSILVNNTVLPILAMVSSAVMLVAILLVLVFIDPWTASGAFAGFAFIYLMVVRVTRRRLEYNSTRISRESTQVIKALQEGLGGIRDVLLDGTQAYYCQIYRDSNMPLRRALASVQIVSGSPRFVIEALAIAMIAWLALGLTRSQDGITGAIPMLGALAIGAQRLLPVLQQLYVSLAALRGGQASLVDALDLLEQPLPIDADQPQSAALPFTSNIILKGLSFQYETGARKVLQDVNLDIPRGSRVGFIGTTGSGKSTLLDVLMGLLEPCQGQLLVDRVPVTAKNRRAWQAHVAHVPQSIFLADATIAENIAFGVLSNDIDMERVRLAAQQARLDDTIVAMPKGYETMTGEGGARLSGGQRQRIGIARALYKRADVIVLDEATSALDNETELSVMDAIEALGRDCTVLMTAHRLSTLAGCDHIVELDRGRIRRFGSYSEITGLKAEVS